MLSASEIFRRRRAERNSCRESLHVGVISENFDLIVEVLQGVQLSGDKVDLVAGDTL